MVIEVNGVPIVFIHQGDYLSFQIEPSVFLSHRSVLSNLNNDNPKCSNLDKEIEAGLLLATGSPSAEPIVYRCLGNSYQTELQKERIGSDFDHIDHIL